jgi:hypothetical protein
MAKQSHTPSRRAMLAGLAAAPVAGLPAFAAASGDDAALLELGMQLEAAWEQEDIAYSLVFDDDFAIVTERLAAEASDRTGEIVGRIIEVKARTFDGLKVKARALAWCHSGQFEGIADSIGNIWWDGNGKIVKETATTDRLVADSILLDLIALADIDRGARS